MILEGRIQTTDVAGGEGTQIQVRMSKNGALMAQDAHGRYYDACRRGFLFSYNLTAVTALSLLSTTCTGLNIYNPGSSPKAVAFYRAVISQATIPGGQFTIGLGGGAQAILPTGLTLSGVVVASCNIGKGSPASTVVQLQSAATVLSVLFLRSIGGGSAATEASQITPSVIDVDLAGEVIQYPGTCVSLTSLVTPVSVTATLIGEEVPAV